MVKTVKVKRLAVDIHTRRSQTDQHTYGRTDTMVNLQQLQLLKNIQKQMFVTGNKRRRGNFLMKRAKIVVNDLNT